MNTTTAVEVRQAEAVNALAEALGEGWTVTRTGRGCRARYGLLTVTLKHHPEENEGAAWRCRLRDSFPRRTLKECWADDPLVAMRDVVAEAVQVRAMINGDLSLAQNRASSWLAYRVWTAVRADG